MNNDIMRKAKIVQRASYRFDKVSFEDFREVCKENGFNQTKVLEKLMREFVKKLKEENENDK